MSYIGLFNETDVSADNIVVSDFVCDTVEVNTSLSSNGTTSLNNTTLTGFLNGLLTGVSNGSDITYTYNASTMTFTIQINNNSINLSKISTTAYTSLNTFSTLVSRDTSGSFRATNITLSGNLSTQILYVYGTTEIHNDLNVYEGHTINLTPSGGLDSPLIGWYTDQSTQSIYISPLNSTINFFNEFGFNKISLTGSSGKIVCNDINIATGQTYKINNVALNTDNIQEKTVSPVNLYFTQGRFDNAFGLKSTSNLQEGTSLYYTQGRFDTAFGLKSTTNLPEGTSLYYTDLRVRTAIVPSNTSEINHTYSTATGILTATINTNSINPSKIAVGFPDQLLVSNHGSTASTWISMSGDATMNTGVLTIGSGAVSNAKLVNSTITINGTSVSLGGSLTIPTTATVTNTSEINLTLTGSVISGTLINNSISLARISSSGYSQASTALTLVQRKSGGGIEADSSTNISYVSALAGVSHTSIFSNITPSLYLGSSSYADGVINLGAKSGTVGTMSGSIIQCNLSNLYIDNVNAGKSINIGTMPVSQNIYIGSLNNSANSVNLLSNGGTITISSPLGLLQVGGSTNTITIGTGQSAGTVLTIGSNNSTPEIKGSTINVGSVSPIINIGLAQASAGTIDIGSSNSIITFRGIINYNALSFNNVKKQHYTNFIHNTSIPITVWSVVYSSTNILQTNITTRNVNSFIRITVNMPLNNWSTVATNKAISIARSTTAFTTGQTVTTDIVPPNTGVLTGSLYGVHHILSGIQYEACNVSFIDTTILGSGTFYYAVVVRSNSLTITAPVLGNNSYVDISLEELF